VCALLFSYSCENSTDEKNENDVSENYQKQRQYQTAVIARIEDDEITFVNKESLLAQLQNEVSAIKKAAIKIVGMRIENSVAVDNDKHTVIQLVGNTQDESLKVTYLLKKEGNEFFIQSKNTILVCEGCRSGCSPRRKENGDGYCTPCDYQAKKCTKTETLPAYTDK
jgi:hypothetical protein